MDQQELVNRFIDAWNRQSVADVLRLMDPQGTFHDTFWAESCSGRDLVRYLDTTFKGDALWYEQDEDIISTPTGVIFLYIAFDRQNPKKRKVLYRGAEILTVVDGLITGVSDFYCNPDPVQLAEIASRIEERRRESNVAPLGLSAKTSGFIRRRLTELGENTTVFIDPALSARELADRVGCTKAHLIHVLEGERDTTFTAFVNERRVSYAATLLAEMSDDAINIGQIAEMSGFRQPEEFDEAFRSIIGMGAEEYSKRIDLQPEGLTKSGKFQSLPVKKAGDS